MKRIVSVILAVGIILANSVALAKEYPQKFWDVSKDHWAFEYIADLADRGVINGYDDGSFKPSKTVSRAEWAKMMVDAAGVVVNDNSTNFTDMANHWANKYVNAAKNYLTGYKDGSYRPDQAATREDVTVAMVKLKGYDLSEVDYSNLSKFKDNDSISNYAKVYVAVALTKDLISGFEDNTFRGQATLTRAEAATLLFRAFQKGNDDKITNVSSQIAENTNNINTEQIENSSISEETKDDPSEQEEKENYVVETLCDANISGVDLTYNTSDRCIHFKEDMFTSDNLSKVYFVENNIIYSVDINGNKEKIFEGSSLDYREGFDSKTTIILNICYDIYSDRLLVVVTQDNGYSSIIYSINTNGNVEKIGKMPYLYAGSLKQNTDNIIAVLSTGDYVYSDYSYVYIGTEALRSVDGSVDAVAEINDYLCFATQAGMYTYDYKNPAIFSEWRTDICGLSNRGVILEKSGIFLVSYPDGTETYIDDYAVKDKKAINPAYKLFLMENDSIVFYDDTCDAFRILKKEIN